jgi:TatD DNase family protein
MSVHSRSAPAATIERLRNAKATRAILHWFSGSIADLDVGLDAGFYLSVNPAMMRSEKGRSIIARLPKDRVLVESDGPYARVAGRQLEPPDVSIAVDYLGQIWDSSSSDVSRQLTANLRSLCDGMSSGLG